MLSIIDKKMDYRNRNTVKLEVRTTVSCPPPPSSHKPQTLEIVQSTNLRLCALCVARDTHHTFLHISSCSSFRSVQGKQYNKGDFYIRLCTATQIISGVSGQQVCGCLHLCEWRRGVLIAPLSLSGQDQVPSPAILRLVNPRHFLLVASTHHPPLVTSLPPPTAINSLPSTPPSTHRPPSLPDSPAGLPRPRSGSGVHTASEPGHRDAGHAGVR